MRSLILWIILLLVFSVFALMVYHGYNPKNRLSRGLESFWNTHDIKQFRMVIRKAFWICIFGFLAIITIPWYFNESGYYPREREVAVFFKAHQWIEGEIQTCYSEATEKTPDAELTAISCSLEGNEFHVLKVTFWGPIKADKKKIWKCERSRNSMSCRLQ